MDGENVVEMKWWKRENPEKNSDIAHHSDLLTTPGLEFVILV